MATQVSSERIITARFNGHCGPCDRQIQVGQQIAWAAGRKARHAECPPVSATPSTLVKNDTRSAGEQLMDIVTRVAARGRTAPECRCGQVCTEIIRGACCICRRDRNCCQYCDI